VAGSHGWGLGLAVVTIVMYGSGGDMITVGVYQRREGTSCPNQPQLNLGPKLVRVQCTIPGPVYQGSCKGQVHPARLFCFGCHPSPSFELLQLHWQ